MPGDNTIPPSTVSSEPLPVDDLPVVDESQPDLAAASTSMSPADVKAVTGDVLTTTTMPLAQAAAAQMGIVQPDAQGRVPAYQAQGGQFPATPVVPDLPEVDETPVEEVDRPWHHHSVKVVAPIFKRGEHIEGAEELVLPAAFEADLNEGLARAPELDLTDSKDSRGWAGGIHEGQKLLTQGETFSQALAREGEEFSNRPEHNGTAIAGGYQKFGPVSNSTAIQGERFVMRMMAHLGIGHNHMTPMLHSGMWISFKPPSDDALIELNRQIVMDKIQLGRRTHGLAFSNTTGIMMERVARFAMDHIYDITTRLEEIPLDTVLEHISVLDFPALVHGVVSAQYPNGFNYRTSCVHDPEKCNHEDTGVIDISKTLHMSFKSLTDWQRNFFSQRQTKVKTLKDVERFRQEFKLTQPHRFPIQTSGGQKLWFTLKVPSVADTIRATHSWIDSITEIVDKALGKEEDRNIRIGLINRYGQGSAMRQYTQWIEKIEFGDDEENNPSATDTETIEKALNRLSGDDMIRDGFAKLVNDFINSTTSMVIGIPAYDCPACGGTHKVKHPNPEFKAVLPMDMLQVFFALHTQRLARISQR